MCFLPPRNVNDSCIEVRRYSRIILNNEISDREEVVSKWARQSRFAVAVQQELRKATAAPAT
ncbi:MAG TPA: hypothetical protein VE994_11910 [Terriglobales bacterium]|nr:hypothetical protein [Terriglobales bacterium]